MSVGERFDLSVGGLYARKRGGSRPLPSYVSTGASFIVKAAIGQALVVCLFRG
jgi:hypothetical protein